MNQLEALRQYTTVVADTGDFLQLAQYRPTDATTNPSLILKEAQKPQYAPLLSRVMQTYRTEPLDAQMDRLLVRFGCEILEVVSGRVSTEVDARLSFHILETIARARRIMNLYAAEGIAPERVLIKIAATWEGIQAAQQLEREGIHTNLTLLFAQSQAIACGHAGVRLISPFVGRIYDWHKNALGQAWREEERSGIHDPGVQSVTAIYHYYKQAGIPTQIMGASFRNIQQILALAGCDLLTIAPELLQQLANSHAPITRLLDAPPQRKPQLHSQGSHPIEYDEASFRYALNQDACATEKLAQGIRVFAADIEKLEALMRAAG